MVFKITTVQIDTNREFTNFVANERIFQFDVVAKWLGINQLARSLHSKLVKLSRVIEELGSALTAVVLVR